MFTYGLIICTDTDKNLYEPVEACLPMDSLSAPAQINILYEPVEAWLLMCTSTDENCVWTYRVMLSNIQSMCSIKAFFGWTEREQSKN